MFSLPVSRFVSIRSCDVGWPDGVHVVSLIVGFRCFVWKLLICSVHAADQRRETVWFLVVSGPSWPQNPQSCQGNTHAQEIRSE